MAIGCSHGNRANKDALAAALLFRDQFKPDEEIHLGDAYDLASLRAGSLANPDDSDHADDYLDDIECGRDFLNALRPTVFIMGNHDQRALKYLRHHNLCMHFFVFHEDKYRFHHNLCNEFLACHESKYLHRHNLCICFFVYHGDKHFCHHNLCIGF